MTAFETRALLKQLEATVEENLDRHLASAEDWMPHEYVPWSQGRNFAALGGEPWSAEQSRLSPVESVGTSPLQPWSSSQRQWLALSTGRVRGR